MSGSEVIKAYDIILGKDPNGHKRRLGDNKTPEGTYVLDYRNSQSIYYKSIHISYPNEKDEGICSPKKGWDPGGGISLYMVRKRVV